MIPKDVIEELLKITRECLLSGNFVYIQTRIKFVEDLYIKCKNYDDVVNQMSRWVVMTIHNSNDIKLINREVLKEKADALDLLYELAKESI